MSTRNNGKRYNDDFRKMIVDLYHSGSSVKNLSSEYGVSEVTIYRWIKDLTPIEGIDGKEIAPKKWMPFKKRTFATSILYD